MYNGLVITLRNGISLICSGFIPFFEQKIQGLFKGFQGHISHFSRTIFSAKKEPSVESMFFFLVLPHQENFHPKVYVFAPFPLQFSLNY